VSLNPPRYRVQVYAVGASHGIGSLAAEFEHAKNIGWSDTLNGVPEAFFTINQDDPKLSLISPGMHVRILRESDVVWAGKLGMEYDANKDDVIFTCYGYLMHLYSLLSVWNKTYIATPINTIVSEQWTQAKTTLANSPLEFVQTGTIENPVTTSGGVTGVTIPKYVLFYKRILFVMQEMAAVGTSDTTNTVVFEITHSATPTFNFWKNRGSQKPDVVFRYGDGRVRDYKIYGYPVYHRNQLLTVGAAPSNVSLQSDANDPTDISSSWGRMQEPIYFSWVRDATELQRVSKLRLATALRTQEDTSLTFFANSVLPPGAAGAGYRLSDQVKVKINRGFTVVDAYRLVTGVKVLVVGGNEHVILELQTPSGS
jgi:hypothetical protein